MSSETDRGTALPTALAAESVGSLPGMAITFGPDAIVREAAAILNADPELPGVIIEASPGKPIVLSRARLFETLSKPYGVAVFMNRPVSALLEGIEPPLIVGVDALVSSAVEAAMNRDAVTRYEPIVVDSGGSYRLVDLRTLLLAQSDLLASAGSIAGKLAGLATALSGTLDLDSVLALVLDSIGELVRYARSAIYIVDEGGLVKAAERSARGAEPAGGPRPDVEGTREPRLSQPVPRDGDDGWATFPLLKGDEALGYLCVQGIHGSGLERLRALVGSFAASAAIAIANARVYAKMEEMASVDQLTGVLNRRAFMDEAARASERAARDGMPMALIMLDLDRFKRVNDSKGHAAGDEVLKATVDLAVSELRGGDIAGRYGGEEFVFLLHGVDAPAAGVAAERIRKRIASAPIECACGPVPVTASLGIAVAVPGGSVSLAAMIEAADVAMYKAKKAGRNRVRFSDPVAELAHREPAPPEGNAARHPAGRATAYRAPAKALEGDSSGKFLKSIGSILGALSQGAGFEELISMALDGIEEIIPGSGAAALIRHSQDAGLEVRAQRNLPAVEAGTAAGIDHSLAARAALERRVFRASRDTLRSIGHPLAANMEALGFDRYRAYPLPSNGATPGALELFDSGVGEPDWHRGVAALASALGAAASINEALDGARKANADLAASYDATLEAWVRMLELRDQETEGHSRRVTEMTLELALEMSVPSDALDTIRRGALLHDIGKMGVPDSILLKAGPLSSEEMEVMRRHPGYAYEVMKGIPFLEAAIDIPYCHHERWDGAGYPRGLKAKGIPLWARLFAVVDVWDALRSDRPYRKALSPEEAAAILASGAGTQFDPDITAVFLAQRGREIFGRRASHSPLSARRVAS